MLIHIPDFQTVRLLLERSVARRRENILRAQILKHVLCARHRHRAVSEVRPEILFEYGPVEFDAHGFEGHVPSVPAQLCEGDQPLFYLSPESVIDLLKSIVHPPFKLRKAKLRKAFLHRLPDVAVKAQERIIYIYKYDFYHLLPSSFSCSFLSPVTLRPASLAARYLASASFQSGSSPKPAPVSEAVSSTESCGLSAPTCD